MSAKFLVLYPTPRDPELFDRRYEREHLPMGHAALTGATSLDSFRVLGSPAGKSPFARLTAVTFPTLKALQDCATLPVAQKTLEHALEISTGGAPHFMILEPAHAPSGAVPRTARPARLGRPPLFSARPSGTRRAAASGRRPNHRAQTAFDVLGRGGPR